MLADEQLNNQLNTIVDFLRLVHPSLERQDGFRPAVELRPVPRGINKKGAGAFALTWALNMWSLDDAAITRLKGFLERHNGQQTCLFYSVFTYKNTSKDEKASHINSKNACFTEEIALDFDNMSEYQYMEAVTRLERIGIRALWVASGHGYQAHILLSEPTYDKSVLETFVHLLRRKGFDCDPHCIDAARVMRLPGTVNNKCFAEDALKKERANPPACRIVGYTTERYSADELLSRLEKIPDMPVDYEQMSLGFTEERAPKKERKKAAPKDTPVVPAPDDAELIHIKYPYISDFELPEAVEKMLQYTPQGYRNKVLGFLVNFFKQNYKLSNEQCYEILKLWSKIACEPPYTEAEFESDFKRFFFTYRGLPYDSALAKQFGVIDFEGYFTLRKKNYIYIPNKFFKSFSEMDGHLIRVYLAIKMLEHDGIDATQDAIADKLGVTKRTVISCLPTLIQMGHCYKVAGTRKSGIPNTYHSSHIAAGKDGYMSLSYAEVHMFIQDLNGAGSTTKTGADLKLYLFFRWKFYSGDVFMSQNKLAEHLGLTRSAIGKATKRLEEQHYIKISKVGDNPLYQHCEYTLLR